MSEHLSQGARSALSIPVEEAPSHTPSISIRPDHSDPILNSVVLGGIARVVEGLDPASSGEAEGSILATIKSPSGMSKDPYSARDSDLVTVYGSQTNIATAIRMGVLSRHPATGALIETGKGKEQVLGVREAARSTTQPTPNQEQTDPMMGVNMSKGEAAFHKALFSAVPQMVMSSALADWINNDTIQDRTVNTMASHMGVTPLEMMDRLEVLADALESQRVRGLNKLGISDIEKFDTWVKESKPDLLRQAKLSHVKGQDFSGYQKLASLYFENLAEIDPLQVLEADFGSGITARQVAGRIILSVPGKGEFDYKAAVRMGLIKVGR